MKLRIANPESKRAVQRMAGLALVLASLIVPAFPFGPLAAPPWTPIAALWAAYGWAAEAEETEKLVGWRGLRAPIVLFAFGLLQDQLAGGPFGLHPVLFLCAYIIGRVAASNMRSPNVLSLWASFIATCIGLCGVAALLAFWLFGSFSAAQPFAVSCAITAVLFPLVRPLYMDMRTV